MTHIYRQLKNIIYKSFQVIWGVFRHLEIKNARWNPLKTKQIQKLAVMAIWQPVGRPAGRPTDPVDRQVIQKRAVGSGRPGDQPLDSLK